MNKGLLGLIIVLLVIILLLIINKKPKHLELTYSINAGIPFKWEVEIEDETVAKLKKSYVTKNENKGAIVGGKVYTKYIFEGQKEGKTTITFKYVNITNEIPPKEEKYNIKVDKNKNIIVLKNKEE